MTENELLAQLSLLFTDVIDEGDVNLTMDTVADDVEGWDSLTHIQIIVAVEKKFGIRFSLNEIQLFKNVGDFVRCVKGKLS
ncbi:MAG TPA: acyl carrier protein [Chitinophagaceae bacterium]|nr:acyl carrier protein [Chitinophagaceae bacterium]